MITRHWINKAAASWMATSLLLSGCMASHSVSESSVSEPSASEIPKAKVFANDISWKPEVPTLAYDDTSIVLNWHQPLNRRHIVDYKVYQDDHLLGLSSENNQQHSPAAPYIQAFFAEDADGFHQRTTYLNYKVTGLSPDTMYRFSVSAVYADGTESVRSAPVLAKTAPAYARVVNIADYGAVGDGVTVNTSSIQQAIDTCAAASQSAYDCKVVIPADRADSGGAVFVSGALFLHSNMTLEIESGATLQGSTNAQDYPLEQGYQLYSFKTNPTDSRRPPSLLNALSETHRNGAVDEQVGYDHRRDVFHNIRIVGGGTIDGSGWQRSGQDTIDEVGNALAYYEPGNREKVFHLGQLATHQMMAAWREYDTQWQTKDELLKLIETSYGGYKGQLNKDLYANRRSSLATFRGVTNVYFAGLTLRNPAYHTIMFLEGKDSVFAYNTVQTFDVNNADGVEFGNSENALIFGNFIDSGDDNINFAAGQGADYAEGREGVNPTENIWIFNNYMREGHGAVVMGSHTGAWIQDLLAEQNVMFLSDNGLRMKSTTATGGGARRIIFRDNAMKNIGTRNTTVIEDTTIENRGGTGSPFVMTLAYSAGDNVFADAENPAQFKEVWIDHITLDNLSADTGKAVIRIDGDDSAGDNAAYPEVFHDHIVFSNLKMKHVRPTSINHLSNSSFLNVSVDGNHRDTFWNIDHSKQIHFDHVTVDGANRDNIGIDGAIRNDVTPSDEPVDHWKW